MKIMGCMFKIAIGLVLGLLTALVMTPAFATFHSEGERASSFAMIIVVLAVAAMCLFAPTIRRAIGRGLLSLGIAFFSFADICDAADWRVATEMMEKSNDGGNRRWCVHLRWIDNRNVHHCRFLYGVSFRGIVPDNAFGWTERSRCS